MRAEISDFLAAVKELPSLRESLRHHEVMPERPAVYAPLPLDFAATRPLLAARGIAGLYSHQARALAAIARGEDVALATPTASGKTLVYNLPVLDRAARDPEARALYLFPLKALEQDQLRRLEADAAALGGAGGPSVAIYDGDTSAHRRKKLRESPPNVLITTPDMLHAGILPHHAQWAPFFRGLRTVVIDELHAYRGIFGSHVAQVLRRLLRVAAFHGARPQFVAASATIANPGELAFGLTGRRFTVVEEDGAPRTRRHVVMLNPHGSSYTAAARLFRLAVGMGLRTIAFTKARKITELIYTWVMDAEPSLKDRVSSYRSGFLPEERREIEARLFSGDLLGVISTSALEMGIDVGGLDVCLLVGYPGSQISTWQRGGRVGRARDAAIALIAMPDALDQFLVAHPRTFFDRAFEHAVVDPDNVELARAHLPCAAAELPLRTHEAWLQTPEALANLGRLEEEGLLLRSEAGTELFPSRRLPHRDVDLRNVGASYAIEDPREGGKPVAIGSIGASRVFAECHEGAIYLHRGRQFLVRKLETDERRVEVRAVNVGWYTVALSEKETEILSRTRARPAGNFRLVEGRVRVTTKLTAYERRRVQGQDLLGTEPLDLPPTSFETTSVWLEVPDEVPKALQAAERHPMGSLHATEHATLALVPLFALCDRHDVAGISTVHHAGTGRAGIFFYDHAPGGVGLVSSLFDRFESLLETTLELVSGCACETGCPGCVHSPRCGNGNRPIDKAGAVQAMRWLLAKDPLPALAEEPPAEPAAPPAVAVAVPPAPQPRLVFFDLETQRSAEDVGGWHNAHLMRVSLAVTYDAASRRFETFRERDVPALLEKLRAAELVVGFNVKRFDYAVLRGYTDEDLAGLATFDLLEALHQRLGFRVSLGHLAEETLGAGKRGDGLQALAWWREGRLDVLEEYCRADVALLRDLFDHATREGHLLMRTKAGERVRLPTRWTLAELVERAHARGR